MSQKIVVNRCYGGFGLSHEACLRYLEIKGKQVWVEDREFGGTTYWLVPPDQRTADVANEEPCFRDYDLKRDDPILVQVVSELGYEMASDRYSELEIVNIPDGVDWEIEEYDGREWISEKHRRW